MIFMALALGFFGSWHCLGMCGPIAIGVQGIGNSKLSQIIAALQYNSGRTSSYMLLGLIIGAFGAAINFSGIQQWLSIFAGIVLILLFIFSINLEQSLYRFRIFKNSFQSIQTRITSFFHKTGTQKPYVLRVVNGFLPCGMVYLALAGALLEGSLMGSVGFMLFFGLGTIPALFGLIMFKEWIRSRLRFNALKSVMPFMQLAVGVYLIYRGIAIEFPDQLDFNLALKNPIMCH